MWSGRKRGTVVATRLSESVEDLNRELDTHGFVLMRGLLPLDALTPLRASLAAVVDSQAKVWFDEGRISDTCEDHPFETRYAALRDQLPARFSNIWRRVLVSPALHELWARPELLSVARSLIGDELYAHGIWNGRPRAPHQDTMTISWHQDAHYYFDWEPSDGRMLTYWIPLVPVDERCGCLQILPGSHKLGCIPPIRQSDGQMAIDQVALDGLESDGFQPLTCEMVPGDVLIFESTMLHRSHANVADAVRWSIDIRYCTRAVGMQKGGPGFVVHSADAPESVESYDAWESKYRYEGMGYDPEGVVLDVELTAQALGVSTSELREF